MGQQRCDEGGEGIQEGGIEERKGSVNWEAQPATTLLEEIESLTDWTANPESFAPNLIAFMSASHKFFFFFFFLEERFISARY